MGVDFRCRFVLNQKPNDHKCESTGRCGFDTAKRFNIELDAQSSKPYDIKLECFESNAESSPEDARDWRECLIPSTSVPLGLRADGGALVHF